MFLDFFLDLRREGVPATLREYLDLLALLEAGLAELDLGRFYHLARSALVKDERWFDRFDRVFARTFGEAAALDRLEERELPEEWLRRAGELGLSEEEKRRIAALGGLREILDALRRRLLEQRRRHAGGSKWVGTGGTSPFGTGGFNPAGVRMGPGGSHHRRAVKVWEERRYRNLDPDHELGTRNFKVALRRLRRRVREGSPVELDLDGTIRATADNAGWLDLRFVPEHRNATRVLLLVDVGGSMDDHVLLCEQLFAAARSELRHLETRYFHNCVYETLWSDNRMRRESGCATTELLRRHGPRTKLIVVGDASMSPTELLHPGGSIEHWNEEPGRAWLRRLLDHFPAAAWLNPVPERLWPHTTSIALIRRLLDGRMYPLTVDGLDAALRSLMSRR